MREIKFRAWNTFIKEMIEAKTIIDGKVVMPDGEEYDFPLMQFTGLHDKNGKRIYEGDIVLYPDTYTETVDVGIGDVPVGQTEVNSFYPIIFKDGMFGIDVTGESEILYKGFQPMRELLECCESLEVIGNIYENPELLYIINNP